MVPDTGKRVDRIVIYIALFIIIILGIRMMAYVVNIFLLSVILTLMLLPAMDWLKKKGLSDLTAVTLITIAACLCVLALILMAFWSLSVLMHDLPQYQAQLDMRIAEISSFISRSGGLNAGTITLPALNLTNIFQIILSSIMTIGESVLYLFFIGVATFFLLLEAPKIPARLAKVMRGSPEKMVQVSRMSRYIIDFMIVRTETNFAHGMLFGGSLWLMGVHAAPVWGLLTFLLCYIPYIGLILAAIPAILFAYIQFGIWGAVAVIAIVCVLNLVVENPVFSCLASRRFEVPAIIVLLSVILWGWLLGVLGMFFSVPITLLVMIVFQSSDDLKKINVLLGVSHLFEEDAGQAAPAENISFGG
ncbi:MAG: pheromone autoinducer 2 transporter [Methanoregula sp. PtaU1.Bin051]|nr:MAG: pheromone autoinducer 2 transporter [Methanoregula sp. PtaU1.Bin051]